MYCRICGDELFEEEHDDLNENEVYYLCPDCELIFSFTWDDYDELKESGHFSI